MIVIAQKNNNESDNQDLPCHNFQTGNKVIAKAMTEQMLKSRPANRSVGSDIMNPVTYQKMI